MHRRKSSTIIEYWGRGGLRSNCLKCDKTIFVASLGLPFEDNITKLLFNTLIGI